MKKRACFSVFRLLAVLVLVGPLLAGCGGLGFGLPEPVEIRFAYLDGAADYQPLADLFHEEHPSITVILEPIPLDNQPDLTLVERASEMDAIRMNTIVTGGEIMQSFLPLDGMISTDGGLNNADFFVGSLEGLQVDGKLLGLPAGLDPFVVKYLPGKFAAAGVVTPSEDWTLEDFVTTAIAVHNVDDAALNTDRYAYGFCSHPALPDLMMFTFLFGGGLFDGGLLSPVPVMNSPENVQAVAWYASLANDFGLMPKGSMERGVGRMLYARNCGFWVDFMHSSIFGDAPVDDAGMLPMPSYVNSFTIAVEDGYFVLNSSEHPDEAYQWIRYLMEQPSASGVLVPPLKSLIASDEFTQMAQPAVQRIARSLPEQTVILGLETYRDERFPQAMQIFSSAVERVINDGIDPQLALDEAQRQAELGVPQQ